MSKILLQVDVRRKAFGNEQVVLQSVNSGDLAFSLRAGEICCLFGPSGCGKSTLLKLIAGVDLQYDGEIAFEGDPVTGPSRSIGMVMQNDTSFPWLSVADNITFAMRYQQLDDSVWKVFRGSLDRKTAQEKAREFANLVQLPQESLTLYPSEISGGMKQRMLFARSLVPGPKLLLLDEPFSALDYDSRQKLQDVLINVRNQLGLAYVCVSHDPDETLLIADQILLLGGQPSHFVERRSPGFHGDRSKQFTVEFQRARQDLDAWLMEKSNSKLS